MAEDWAETTRTVQFEKSVEFQLAEQTGLLKPLAGTWKNVTGEKVEITDRFSHLNAEEITERNGKTQHQDTSVERRWIHKPNRSAIHALLDPDDQMATEVDIMSPLPIAIAEGIRRYQDDQFLIGFYGTAYTGKEGLTAVPFDSGQVQAADFGETAANYTGLTLAKLRGIVKKFRQNLVNIRKERPLMVVTAEDIDDLLQIDQYISRDYNPDSQSAYKPMSSAARQALQDGEPTPFLGIMFIPAELTNESAYPKTVDAGLTVNGSSHRRLPVWVPSGMAGRSWLDFQPERDKRPDMNHSEQFSGYSSCRFSRVHEKKCMIVEVA